MREVGREGKAGRAGAPALSQDAPPPLACICMCTICTWHCALCATLAQWPLLRCRLQSILKVMFQTDGQIGTNASFVLGWGGHCYVAVLSLRNWQKPASMQPNLTFLSTQIISLVWVLNIIDTHFRPAKHAFNQNQPSNSQKPESCRLQFTQDAKVWTSININQH